MSSSARSTASKRARMSVSASANSGSAAMPAPSSTCLAALDAAVGQLVVDIAELGGPGLVARVEALERALAGPLWRGGVDIVEQRAQLGEQLAVLGHAGLDVLARALLEHARVLGLDLFERGVADHASGRGQLLRRQLDGLARVVGRVGALVGRIRRVRVIAALGARGRAGLRLIEHERRGWLVATTRDHDHDHERGRPRHCASKPWPTRASKPTRLGRARWRAGLIYSLGDGQR